MAESSNVSLAIAVGLALFCLIVGCWIVCLLLQPPHRRARSATEGLRAVVEGSMAAV